MSNGPCAMGRGAGSTRQKESGKGRENGAEEGEPSLRPNLSYWFLAVGIHHSGPLRLCVLVYSFNKKKKHLQPVVSKDGTKMSWVLLTAKALILLYKWALGQFQAIAIAQLGHLKVQCVKFKHTYKGWYRLQSVRLNYESLVLSWPTDWRHHTCDPEQ